MMKIKRLRLELRSLLGRDDIRVVLRVVIGLAGLLVAFDTMYEPPEWKHVLEDLHGVWFEITLMAVVAAIWIQRRERQRWQTVRPLIVARVLRACNAGLEAVHPGVPHQCVYRVGEHDVACSFELDRLWPVSLFSDEPPQSSDALTVAHAATASALRSIATSFGAAEATPSRVVLIRSKIGQAQALVDSALNLASLVVSRGVEAEEVAGIARLQDALSALHTTANTITGIDDLSQDERNDARFQIADDLTDVLDTCLLVGGPLAASATKTSWEAAAGARLDTLRDRIRHHLEVQAGQAFATYQDATNWAWAMREDD